MKLKRKDLVSCLSRTCLFYSITLQCWTWKHMVIIIRIKWTKFFNKFPET